MRRSIIHGSIVMKASWKKNFVLSWRPLLAVLALFCVVGVVQYQVKGPEEASASSFSIAAAERPSTSRDNGYRVDSFKMELIDGLVVSPSVISVIDKTKVRFQGWAGDVSTGSGPEEVLIVLDGKNTYFIMAFRNKRQDVADYFNRPGHC